MTHQLSGVDGAGCGGEGGILGGEGGHGLSGLITERLGARDRGSIRLQWNQVSHLELQRTDREGGGGGGGAAEQEEGGARQSEKQAGEEKDARFVFQGEFKF